ncbi:gp65 [Bacillus phage G]|uniref:Gp65 n=1 Tax=Bacillus phage G TaxID=2884420 RepID=G3MBD5_9CAUD|nr:gp65 [Bacillus phage G]AEO93336.1 gp65 [Bacillus phage G]
MKIKKKASLIIMTALLASTLAGCRQPYDKPEFVEIGPNETAFVLQMEGDTKDQGKFESEEFLMENLVAAKRIEIPHKWIKTGRGWWKGKYVDKIRVIKVDRTTVTREWTTEGEKKQGIKVESKDSIKFSVGTSATAQIVDHESAAKFLFWYSGRTLADVMDTEIRNRFETAYIEEISKLTMEEIRGDKSNSMNVVRKQVESYFAERGITLSNIGYKGELVYDDPEVQKALSAQFVAEQNKKAQDTINSTNEEKANSEARAAATRQKSLEAQTRIMELENQKALIEKLDKVDLPKVWMSGSNSTILDLPADLLEGTSKK